MASCSKKPRLENVLDLHSLPKKLIAELGKAFDGLCIGTLTSSVTLRPLKILNSNGADKFGIPFSKAYCSLDDTNKLFMFADIFRHGLDILMDFLEQGKVPDGKTEQHVLTKLAGFLLTLSTTETHHAFQNLDRLSESELTTVLANHLFGKLAASPNYTIDKNGIGKKKNQCLCSEPDCKLTGSYGDTSIGHGDVWHGSVGIIINDDLVLEPLDEEPDNPPGKSPVEVKLRPDVLSNNAQLIAETIVFSFLQMQRHPERDYFLTPCIGIGSSDLVVVFYDSEHDILLESSRVSLFDSNPDEEMPKQLSFNAVLISWLVVNHKYLSSGLTDEIKCSLSADFYIQADKKLEIYKSQLKYQNVGISTSSEKKRMKDIVFRSDYTFEKHTRLAPVIFHAEKDDTE